jgi:site-specific recombinase XerD
MKNKIYPDKPIYEQIAEYAKHCSEEKNATSQTMYGRVWTLENFAKSVPVDTLEEVTEGHINEWLESQIERGCSGRTANNRYATIRPMIHYFRDMGLTIPARLVKVKHHLESPPRRVYLTAGQIEKVLSCCDPMEWLLIRIPFDTGLRLTELANLRMREIHDRRLNYIGKGRKQRESYMSPETRERLDDYIARKGVADYLWANPYSSTGKPYCSRTIYYRIKRVMRYAGFGEGYPHALRHSFATDLQINGATPMEARDMLGHQSVETTQRYLHGLTGHLQELFDRHKFGIHPKTDPEDTPNRDIKLDEGATNFLRKLAEEFAVATR